jgi:hypothetical protein
LDARLNEAVNNAFRAEDNSLVFPFTSSLSFWLETINHWTEDPRSIQGGNGVEEAHQSSDI